MNRRTIDTHSPSTMQSTRVSGEQLSAACSSEYTHTQKFGTPDDCRSGMRSQHGRNCGPRCSPIGVSRIRQPRAHQSLVHRHAHGGEQGPLRCEWSHRRGDDMRFGSDDDEPMSLSNATAVASRRHHSVRRGSRTRSFARPCLPVCPPLSVIAHLTVSDGQICLA